MNTIIGLISSLIDLYMWVVIIYVVLSWLVAFDIINTRNQFVAGVWRVLNQITEPILRREVARDLEALMNTVALESSLHLRVPEGSAAGLRHGQEPVGGAHP